MLKEKDLEKITYDDKKVAVSDLIALWHNTTKADINKLYARNAERFINGKDVVVILKSSDDFRNYSYLFTNNKQKAVYLFTERGYLKLVKIMNNDRAWDIYEEVIDVFFAARETVKSINDMSIDETIMVLEKKLAKKVEQNSKNIDVLFTQIDYHEDYYTVTAYVNNNHIKGSTKMDYKKLGKKATQLSKEQGYEIYKAPDTKWGAINTYHVNILKQLDYNI